MARFQSRVKRTRRGDFQLRLPQGERELLRSLPAQLRDALGGDDLTASHRRSLEVMETTIDAERLNEDQLTAWMGALNDLRLVLGTRLDVTEESYDRPPAADDPDGHAFAVFVYLGWLEEQIVEALASGLDPRGTEG
jgi:Domain of unknown function (DUF2017)